MSLALRCGLPHYDFLLPKLSASQLNDIVRFHTDQNISFDREDAFWASHLAMYFNVNRPEGSAAKAPNAFIPWKDSDPFTNPIKPSDLRKKLGFTK